MDNRFHGGGYFDRPEEDYAPILAYARAKSGLTYPEFDSDIIKNVDLFALRENFDFDGLEEILDRIIRTLPSVRKIFSSPITRLKDSDEILPVESVRIVNNHTLVHASSHSELWSNITKEGPKPRKLLTLTNEDDYCIYENLIFVYTVDTIRHLVDYNTRILREMLFSCGEMSFTLPDRTEHPQYFFALGKLHVGYIRDFGTSRERAEALLDKMAYIRRVIRAGMGMPVYVKCKKQKTDLPLKKTTVFRVQKDYHKVYLLMKWFLEQHMDSIWKSAGNAGEGYAAYCTLLSIFAAGHFNFTFPESAPIDLLKMKTECAFRNWKLSIEGIGGALLFTFTKDKSYKILLIPITDREKHKDTLALYKEHVKADEYLSADPFGITDESLYLSIFDITSFQRVQQFMLRGMVYSDESFESCPFCGQPLETLSDEEQGIYHRCPFCKTQIMHLICPEKEKVYHTTKLIRKVGAEGVVRNRNITPVNDKGEPICPFCKGEHIVPLHTAETVNR